jgi:hypothetical protein
MGWTTEEYPIDSRLRQGILFVYKKIKTGPGAHPASHSRGTGVFPHENKVSGSESYLHLLQRLRMNGAVPPPPHTPLWQAYGLHFYLVNTDRFVMPNVM